MFSWGIFITWKHDSNFIRLITVWLENILSLSVSLFYKNTSIFQMQYDNLSNITRQERSYQYAKTVLAFTLKLDYVKKSTLVVLMYVRVICTDSMRLIKRLDGKVIVTWSCHMVSVKCVSIGSCGIVACSMPSLKLKQCWLIVCFTFGSKFQ